MSKEVNFIDRLQEGLKTAENHIIRWVIYTFLGAITIGIGFYYTTKSTLAAHETSINAIQNKVDKVVLVPIIQTEQIITIKEGIKEMNNRQSVLEEKYDTRLQRMEQRQDDIYTLVLEMSKKRKEW